ncbi:MAG: M20/M25/M40 family metallo-hydrolase [Phycisphaeraceae bacterium]|nr:M20/M25/M40 family metallo-hydrolase [Phycisphaeraceae bacterium]
MSQASVQLDTVETRICEDLAGCHGAMLGDLARHVAIPTGGGHDPGLDEYRGLLLERLEAIGGAVELVEGDPRPVWLDFGAQSDDAEPARMPPRTAVVRFHGNGPRILIACHLDTVFDPKGPFREMTIAPDGATAIGPGVVDMKGGVLTTLNALEALAGAGHCCNITLALTSDEETGSYASNRILRELAREADIGIATEPALPGGELVVERSGSGQFRVETRGRSAHVGRAFTDGVSAVTALAQAIIQIAAMPDPDKGRILNIGPLLGGPASNAVPDLARAWGNVRFPTSAIADELSAMLSELQTPADAMPSVRIDCSFNRPAKPLTPAVERFAELARSCAESLGQAMPFAKTGGVCDGNILQDEGLPTIDTLGVRGGGLHTPQEWIDLSSLVERSQLMAVLLKRLAQGALTH